MFDVTNFLMRWLFLCNLVRDVAEIQTLPFNPQQAHLHHVEQSVSTPVSCEEEWRDHCLRGILSYPPGTQRLLVMDAMRAEIVNKLSTALRGADEVLRRYEDSCRRRREQQRLSSTATKQVYNSSQNVKDDPFLDADLEIIKAFERETLIDNQIEGSASNDREALLVIANNSTEGIEQPPEETQLFPQSKVSIENGKLVVPTPAEVEDAQRTIRAVRDYLPQLVSMVLRSPAAFEPNLLDPIDRLRNLIIQRCVDDANWGVDMCWLLEAEVGRAWKKLFEHRQQTGRRLIVVLPAEKAAVLAKIGTEKREAFDLLQDAEQATAYGNTVSMNEEFFYHGSRYGPNEKVHGLRARLPSSLSLRRCSHFGDTMHFIDRLTMISLEMRQVPTIHRHAYLQDSLREMNRRIRRRMVTQGDVSLDVEDNRGPYDWPQLPDIASDMLQYSVHLPLDPTQCSKWPGGDMSEKTQDGGVVRVLNIVVDECRTLSSRERCPFLIHVEVVETGLSGKDSRLFADGALGLGTTIEEALSMSSAATGTESMHGSHSQMNASPYQIPSELLEHPVLLRERKDSTEYEHMTNTSAPRYAADSTGLVRGGSQSDEALFYAHNPDEVWASGPYDNMRQNDYEQLHQQMYVEHSMQPTPSLDERSDHIMSTREALLDRVFGQRWEEKCEEVRQASPFGKTEGWRLASFIVKAGEDIRRESLVMQIISNLNEWFQREIPEPYRPHMRPYTIMCVGGDAGLVECLSDAKSIDEVKKKTDSFVSLRDYFIRAYGPPTTHSAHYANGRDHFAGTGNAVTFEQAQDNFLRSLVGSSLVCYILQIKDRHNANILIDREGNIMHIDFGFVLGDSPKMSKVPIFSERAPFKLSTEFWEVLGGWNVKEGGLGVKFCNMFEQAFACAASHTEEIASLVEASMMTLTQNPRQAKLLANGVRSRLKMRGPPGSVEQKQFIMELVDAALTSWGTPSYDWLQKNMNGYQ